MENNTRMSMKTKLRKVGDMLKIKRLIPVMFFVLAVVPLFSQSDTRYDADKNLPFNEKAGDVNPQTGNIAISATDLSLPGRGGFHFSFGRIWNLNQSNLFSMYIDPDDGSNRLNSNTIEKYNRLGAGWSTNIPYIFKDSSSGELILSLFLGGSVYEIDRDGILKTGSTESNLPGYDLKDKHIEQNRGTSYGDFGLYNLPDLAEEYEIADSETDRSYYLLLLKDNSQYWFREDGRLMMHEDKTGLNRIWYFYDEDARLSLVVDTLGRKISFTYDDAGNLGEVAWQVVTGRMDDREGRSFVEERRSVIYRYKNGEEWEGVNRLKESGQVVSYRPPYILEEVSDPMGNVTRYEWEAGEGAFTFNADDALNTNIFMLLTKIISCYTEDGKYLNQRVMSYEQPLKGAHTKEFYNGFMEYYKISGQYFLDITGRKVNEIRYYYYDNNENGNYNRYSTEITRGNLTTQYTYSLSDDPAKKEVLENISITTLDNFTQITDFTYDAKRRKILEEVTRMGGKIYEEKFNYDDKGNIVRYADRMGLTTTTIYDDKYSIPINQYKTFREGEDEVTYETETVINDLGQVREHYLFLAGENGENRKVLAASIEYDQYGNPVSQTDAEGRTVYTAYDNQYHTFPVKIWQDVDIASWPEGDVHANWQTDPPGMRTMTLRSWKVFNSDGTVWIEVDNEGYALEHYYDKLGTEIRVFNPDQDDLRDFGAADFTDFYRDNPAWVGFLISRENNPGVRMEISYQDDFVKSFTDIDRTLGHVKVAAVQRDGAGNTVKEIEYDADGDEYAVKHMVYDTLGRMIALTDPDAGENSVRATIHGTSFDQYDKTWRVWYDDLGRQKMVKYPSTEKGKVETKLLRTPQ